MDLWRVLLDAVGHGVASGEDILTDTRDGLTGTQTLVPRRLRREEPRTTEIFLHKS
jgi:hypothetical protein